MTKKVFILALGLTFLANVLSAQTSMRVPRGSFEQWTSHPGYSISFLTLNVPVYDSFSTPTGWDYLSYPVNETISIPGLPLTINTTLPLVKVSRETGVVPDSASALKLHTFMLEDLINPDIYSIVENNLDSMLTQTVFPSVLSTGTVDLETFLPIVTNMLSNMDSIEQILASLASVDVNELISGGVDLGGFEPTRMTGSYKYQAAGSGDNGGVLLLGTHYNSATQQRDVVGGGANLALTNIANYTPFTVDYVSLHSLDSAFPEQAPDSLIVILLSSASNTMQQGSYLCVDNLVLWHDTVPVVEPDTCAAVVGLTATPDIHEALLNWSTTASVVGYELEYGLSGFAQGSGTLLTLANNTVTLTNLTADALYDCYLRTLCNDSVYGEWSSIQFRTNPDTCYSVLHLRVEAVTDPYVIYHLVWSAVDDHVTWEVQYGEHGFELGTGNTLTLTTPDLTISYLYLENNTDYDFYVRSKCPHNVYGEWDSVMFHSPCGNLSVVYLGGVDNITVTPDHLVTGYRLTWEDRLDIREWEVEYGNDTLGFVQEVVASPIFYFPPLAPSTHYKAVVKSFCGENSYGEGIAVDFTTVDLPEGISTAGNPSLVVSPNPAHGQCQVTMPGGESAELKLFSLDGRLLHSATVNGTSATLQLPSQGIFLLQATTASGTAIYKITNN